ncbi:hypothetical protein ACFOSD_06340 [Salinispirillum marinum]|uniref:Uncharacterized protein n=2 Tax=Saccharospirillaceae TaxID=255527 RepID=A0ABV8BEX0_9GAMM
MIEMGQGFDSFCHENIRLAEAVGIGNHADNLITDFLVELKRMTM